MHVRFTPVAARILPIGHVAASELLGEVALWKISAAHVDLRDAQVIERLDEVGSDASRVLAPRPRENPTAPWGELRIEEHDIELRDMSWTLTEAGFLIRMPAGLLTARLRAEIEVIGTEQMRFFDAPDREVWRKIMAEREAARREGR